MKVSRVHEGFHAEPEGEDPRDIEQGRGEVEISVADDDISALIQTLAKMAGLPPGRYMFEEIPDPATQTPRAWVLEIMQTAEQTTALNVLQPQRDLGSAVLSNIA